MAGPIVTLTTDFGTASPYVAAMKGVLLSVNPAAHLVDLTHDIPPQDLHHAAYFLAAALPYFPETALHVVVVDPGVGTERAVLFVEIGGCRLLVPDNGCWTHLPERGRPPVVIRLENKHFWRKDVSDTFHGRDIFAPVAGRLSLGVEPHLLGSFVTDWVRLARSEPTGTATSIRGHVVFVDHFGNLITDISRDRMKEVPPHGRVLLGAAQVTRWVRTYGEAAAGELVALFSSEGRVEVAVAGGNAARRLGVGVGTEVVVGWDE